MNNCMLVGDIGGTNVRLALFAPPFHKIEESHFHSRQFPALLPILQEFTAEKKLKISKACFGVAGPVQNGVCHTTNLPWIIDSKELSESLDIPEVLLLNDVEAHAWGIRALQPQDFLVLQPGNPHQAGNAALIAAGTGLGEAGMYWDGTEHYPFACEGGHVDFSPRDEREIELLTYLSKQFPSHVSWERIVSGPGLYQIYRFLIESGREKENYQIHEEMTQGDPPAIISKWHERDRACKETIDWFISLYGSQAGNLALTMKALGGMYVSGGVALHLFKSMKRGGFVHAFCQKGRFQKLLESIPIRMICNPDIALLGGVARLSHKQ